MICENCKDRITTGIKEVNGKTDFKVVADNPVVDKPTAEIIKIEHLPEGKILITFQIN